MGGPTVEVTALVGFLNAKKGASEIPSKLQ